MKQIFLILLATAILSCSNDTEKPDVKVSAPAVIPSQQQNTYQVTIPGTATGNDSIPENGEYVKKYENGQIQMQGMMKNGKREGLWKSFYEDGTPWSQTTFKEGKKDGPTTTWYENGKKRYEGNYKNDSESGIWKYYDEKGVFIKDFDYDKQQ